MRVLLSASLLTFATALHPPPQTRRTILSGGAAASLAAVSQPAFAAKNRDDPTYGVRKTIAEWKGTLTDYQYFVLRTGGTEPPNTSPLVKEKRAGTFRCTACDLPG